MSFRLYAPLADELSRRGLDVPGLLASAGLPFELLHETEARVPLGRLEALWQLAIKASGDPQLALHAGLAARAHNLGLVAYLVTASESGPDAIALASNTTRYFVDNADVDLVYERGLAVIRFAHAPEHRNAIACAEYSVALTVAISRELGPQTAVGAAVEARFAHPAPPSASRYEAILGLPVHFGASHNGAAFPLTGFRAPNPRADPALRALLERYAAELLARLPADDSFSDRVRGCIAEQLPSGAPGIETIAVALKMSTRTLRRRLHDEGTHYREVLDDVRHTLALQQLGAEGRPSIEVAYRLGFADASGFHKAFRRWTGQSPAEFARGRSDQPS